MNAACSQSTAPVLQSSDFYFGAVNQGSVAPIKHRFVLKNGSSAAVVVTGLTPSCGCTTAVADGGASLPVTIASGGQVGVDVALDLLRVTPGAVEKTVSVSIQGSTQPAATLSLTGTMVSAASFSPDVLNFGDVAYRDDGSVEFTAEIDKRIVPSFSSTGPVTPTPRNNNASN
jgi:hypothetical protein